MLSTRKQQPNRYICHHIPISMLSRKTSSSSISTHQGYAISVVTPLQDSSFATLQGYATLVVTPLQDLRSQLFKDKPPRNRRVLLFKSLPNGSLVQALDFRLIRTRFSSERFPRSSPRFQTHTNKVLSPKVPSLKP